MTSTKWAADDTWAEALMQNYEREHHRSNAKAFYGLWYNAVYAAAIGWKPCKTCGLERPTGQLVHRKCANCLIELGRLQRTQEGK